MNTPDSKTNILVDTYLELVDNALTGVPADQRDELLADLRLHISAEREALPEETEADLRQILDRLGPPETVAAAARSDAPLAPLPPPERSRLDRRIVLAIVAFVLLAALGAVMVVLLFFAQITTVSPN